MFELLLRRLFLMAGPLRAELATEELGEIPQATWTLSGEQIF
jgi:hypothetical protein